LVWFKEIQKGIETEDRITENERIDKYRLSAINERLAAHQKAFEIWYNLSLSIHSDENIKIKMTEDARQFWITNCLYLTSKCRKVFDDLIFEFGMYRNYRQMWFDTKEKK
jgi:hypothetical protein